MQGACCRLFVRISVQRSLLLPGWGGRDRLCFRVGEFHRRLRSENNVRSSWSFSSRGTGADGVRVGAGGGSGCRAAAACLVVWAVSRTHTTAFEESRSGQVWGHIPEQRVAASTLRRYFSASVWPLPRQTPGPPCPYPSDRTPPYATMKRVGAPSAWSSPSDLDKKESDGRDPPQGVAPHAHRGVVTAYI